MSDAPAGKKKPSRPGVPMDSDPKDAKEPKEPREHFPVAGLEEEMRRSYLDYAMSVIIGRAIPDIKDGLKPVHRRILFAMEGLSLHANSAYKKCAAVVG